MTIKNFAEELEQCTRRCREMDAPLPERLRAFADDVRRLNPPFAEIVDRMVSRLNHGGAGGGAPDVGDPMPEFVLPDEQGRLVSLPELLGKGPAVIAFQRGHWCHYCRLTTNALAEIQETIEGHGGHIVAITPEIQAFTQRLKKEAGAHFPILTDMDNGYALDLNLAIHIEDEKRQAMISAGWDISDFQDNENWTLPIPATFVVGTDGIIKARFVDPDYRRRMGVEDILVALQ